MKPAEGTTARKPLQVADEVPPKRDTRSPMDRTADRVVGNDGVTYIGADGKGEVFVGGAVAMAYVPAQPVERIIFAGRVQCARGLNCLNAGKPLRGYVPSYYVDDRCVCYDCQLAEAWEHGWAWRQFEDADGLRAVGDQPVAARNVPGEHGTMLPELDGHVGDEHWIESKRGPDESLVADLLESYRRATGEK